MQRRINDATLFLMVCAVCAAFISTCMPILSAAEYMQLRKAAIEGGSYQGVNRDYFLLLDREGETLQHTTDMLMDADLVCLTGNTTCLFWNNAIRSKASNKQYRSVAWDYRLGISIGDNFELGWRHISRHELDTKSSSFGRFELENVLFVQFKFLDRPRTYGGK